ncbi:MAG TPA: hypothetical protein VKY36_05825 [Moheibacter sp.]|nr:hypothetical protein [Moheibacter sp.]
MNTNQQLSKIFNLFHDGAIESYRESSETLILKIECTYLANLLNQNFNFFILELKNISIIEFDIFNQSNSSIIKKSNDIHEIFSAEIQIFSSEIINGIVNVNCWQINDLKGYCGNNLKIVSENIQLYDEEMNNITIEDLSIISDNYWNNFHKA